MLHVGGAPLQVAKDWGNNGRGAVKDWLGGGENVRTKDAAVLHQTPEMFISMMLLDGVFDRHPGLRGAAVELGAGWVPELCRRLDWVCRIYGRSDTSVRFERPPSRAAKESKWVLRRFLMSMLVIWLLTRPDLYLFSSDYPHLEGTKDPIGRFERSLVDVDESVKQAFYSEETFCASGLGQVS